MTKPNPNPNASEADAASGVGAPPRRIAVTGAAGYVGRLVVDHLAQRTPWVEHVLAIDVRERPAPWAQAPIHYERRDVRSDGLRTLLEAHRIEALVHLASIVAPPRGMSREAQYAVDVLGTRNVIEAAAAAGCRHLIHASSGAAYGYHPDQPVCLRESDPLRGNEAFAYAWHKRLAEEELARARERHPALHQLVLRLSTVLGPGLHNQITSLWSGPVVLGVRGTATPFSIIWDQDVVRLIVHALAHHTVGIYNVAGGGTITLREIAALRARPFVQLPAAWIARALWALGRVGLSRFGPEQVMFVAHRPVLANDALINEVGFRPRLTSREVFELWLAHEEGRPEPVFMRRLQNGAPPAAGGRAARERPTADGASQSPSAGLRAAAQHEETLSHAVS